MIKKNKNSDNLIFIPARGGSTRIKNKNLKKINGISLLKKKILVCKKANIGRIVVSSECSKILKEASNLKGVEIFKRNVKYSTSYASSISAILEYLRVMKKNNRLPKYITLAPVTNPFLSFRTLKNAFRKIKKSKDLKSLISITECSEHPYLHVKIEKKIKFNIFKLHGKVGSNFERSQDMPKSYVESASVRISKINYFLKFLSNQDPKFSKPLYDQKSCGFIKIKKIESFDINTLHDLKLARIMRI